MGMYESLFSRYGDCFTLQDDGSGPYINTWVSVEPQPTPQDISGFLAEDVFYDQVVAIEAEYAPQFLAIRNQVLTAFVADGDNMDTIIAGLRTEWSTLSNAKDAAIMALFV